MQEQERVPPLCSNSVPSGSIHQGHCIQLANHLVQLFLGNSQSYVTQVGVSVIENIIDALTREKHPIIQLRHPVWITHIQLQLVLCIL